MDRTLPRRTLVRGAGALGIASLALPPAAAHATALEPQTAVDLTGTPFLAGFSPGNVATTPMPDAANGIPDGSGVSGSFTFSGMTGLSDNRTWFSVNNSSSFPDIFGGGSYWQFTLSTGAKAVNPAALLINYMSSVRHTVAVRTDANGYATNLRLLTPLVQDNRVVVNLTSLGTLPPNDSLTIRCFFYGNTSGLSETARMTGSGSAGTPYDATLDTTSADHLSRNAVIFGDVIEP